MVKIYTKTGDAGQTSLFTGERVAKYHELILAYGTIDELNSIIGCVRAQRPSNEIDQALSRLQHHLFDLGTDLAMPESQSKGDFSARIQTSHTQTLEQEIDQFNESLPALKNFILPGGHPTAALLHQARCVCRRAETLIVQAMEKCSINPEALRYCNRLSDWLFVAARLANQQKNVQDTVWESE